MEMDGMVQDGDLDDFILPLPRSRIMRRIQDRTERIRGQMSAISGTCSTCTSSVTDDRSSIPFQERFAAFRNEGRRHIKIRSKRRGRPTANLKLRITCLSGPGTTKISGMKIAKLTKIGLGCSSKTAHNIPLEWKEEDFKNFIRSQFPPLGCIKFTFWKLENRELVPIPEGIDTPIQLKDWGNMKRSALYIVPETHLSSPCENENGTCSYVDAGTPTVQFRMSENMLGLNTDYQSTKSVIRVQVDSHAQTWQKTVKLYRPDLATSKKKIHSAFVSPLENISLASEGITEMDTAINDFIPEVPPTTESSTTSSLSVDSIKDFIEGHRLDFINMNSEDPILLEVRRDHVLMDALAVMRFSQSDLHNPFQIKFCGEQGVDIGGLRREFWSLFLYQFSHSAFVTGKPGRLTFQSNFLEKKKKTFFYLGQLVAMSALQDGPGAPIFSEIVTDFILNEQTTLFEADDLMDHVKEHLQTMETCSSETDLQQHFSNLSDIATDAGFLVPITKFTKQHLSTLKACLVENQVVSCREELEQFIEGLNIHQFLGALRQDEWRSRARVLFSGKVKPVTAATVRSLLNFKFTEGRERPLQMETGQSFLTFLQATKVSEAKVNGIEIKPRDVLMWLTGATNIPACGFHKAIDVDFGTITSVNTCALCCTLEVKKHNTPEDAVLYFSELLINSQTFSKE